MRRKFLRKEWIVVFSSIFIFSTFAFALDEDHIKVQGRIKELDVQKKTLVVSEAIFSWNQNTVFYDEQGNPIKNIERLKLNTWVYIEGELGTIKNCFLAKNIYFLPKLINGNKKNLFPYNKSNKN